MKLTVYKGFDSDFYRQLEEEPLVENDIEGKMDVLKFDKNVRKRLNRELLSLEDRDSVWVTYEEYTLIRNNVEEAVREDGLELVIWRNNLYPDYYPLAFELDEDLKAEIAGHIQGGAAERTGGGLREVSCRISFFCGSPGDLLRGIL